MGGTFHVDFDGERIASGVQAGWFDDTPRSLDVGNVSSTFGHVEIAEEPIAVAWDCTKCGTENLWSARFCSGCGVKAPEAPMCDVFIWTDNTNTRPGHAHDAGVISRRLLDEDGAHLCGYFIVYPTTAAAE